MEQIKSYWTYLSTGNRPKVFLQTGLLLLLSYFMFNAGRVIEQDTYVKTLDREYPLRPQAYFGGIKVNHLVYTW